MGRINQDLLSKIMRKLDVSKGHAYAIIGEAVRRTTLPANVAAIVVARDAGVSVFIGIPCQLRQKRRR